MASTLDKPTFNNMMDDILEAPSGADRVVPVNKAVAYLLQQQALHTWARGLANNEGYHDATGREDLVSVIAEKLVTSFRSLRAAPASRNWVGYAYGLAKHAISDYLSSGQITPASGMSGKMMRSSKANVARRDLLATLGRNPTQQEIIDFSNAFTLRRLLADRARKVNTVVPRTKEEQELISAEHLQDALKTAKRQGLMLTDDDFTTVTGTAASLDELAENGYEMTADMYAVEKKIEASAAARLMIQTCRSLFPEEDKLPEIAETWVQLHLHGEAASAVRVANITGVSRQRAAAYLVQIDEVLGDMRLAS